MSETIPNEQGFIQWLVGSLGALMMAVIGHIYATIGRTNGRITRAEDSETARHKDEALHEQVAHDRLWGALNQNARDLGDFKERVLTTLATKDDLRGLEDRLIAVLQHTILQHTE